MNNNQTNNNNNGNKTFVNIAQGWDGKKPGIITFVSDPERTTAGKNKQKFTLLLKDEWGNTVEVKSFFVKALEKGRISEKGKTLPEYQCTIVVD